MSSKRKSYSPEFKEGGVKWWVHHWTDHKIRVHVFYCVLALAIAHLMRREAEHVATLR